MDCRHEEPGEQGTDGGEDLDQRVAPRQLVGLVVARAHVHDRGEMSRLEQSHAARKSDKVLGHKNKCKAGQGGLQEAEDVELVHVLDTGVGKSEDGPGKLQECNVQGGVNLFYSSERTMTSEPQELITYPCQEQIRGNLPKDVRRTPDGRSIVELFAVKREILLHTTVCRMY